MQKILLYNHIPAVRDMVRIFLKKKFFVVSHDDPQKIISLLCQHDFSLIIVGIQNDPPPDEQKLLLQLGNRFSGLPCLLLASSKNSLKILKNEYSFIDGGIYPPFSTDTFLESISIIFNEVKSAEKKEGFDPLKKAISSPKKGVPYGKNGAPLNTARVRSSQNRLIDVPAVSKIFDLPVVLFYDHKGKSSLDTKLLIKELPQTGKPILLLGYYGSKEEVVPHVHHLFCNNTLPFLTIQCNRIPEKDLEIELNSISFEPDSEKHPGTIFFRCVDNLSSTSQDQLLEWTYTIDRNISKSMGNVPPGIFFSSTPDLYKKLDSGDFNRDLFYRISGYSVHFPQIKDLGQEIFEIFESLLNLYTTRQNQPTLSLTDEIKEFIQMYSWPWNFLEMEWVIQKILATKSNIPPSLRDLAMLTTHFQIIKLDEPGLRDVQPVYPAESGQATQQNGNIDTVLLEIVHNIKNPLVAIKTFAQLLPDKFNDAEFRENFSRIVNEDIDRIDSFLSDITFHIQLGDPQIKKLDMNKFISDIFEELKPEAETAKISLLPFQENSKIKSKKNVPVLKSDPRILRYVINNIVQQGISDLDPGGKITISCIEPDTKHKSSGSRLIIEMDGSKERKNFFATMTKNVPETLSCLKIILAERVLHKINASMDQDNDSENTSIILHLP